MPARNIPRKDNAVQLRCLCLFESCTDVFIVCLFRDSKKCVLHLITAFVFQQASSAVCSSLAASALWMSWWPSTTAKNPCRRLTSPSFCKLSADTSGCSGRTAKEVQHGLHAVPNPPAARPPSSLARVRRSGWRTEPLRSRRPGKMHSVSASWHSFSVFI